MIQEIKSLEEKHKNFRGLYLLVLLFQILLIGILSPTWQVAVIIFVCLCILLILRGVVSDSEVRLEIAKATALTNPEETKPH